MLDFRNLNTLWASILVETLVRCGLTTAILCPGSRSAPLTVAFAQHPHLEAIPVLDERSASFFALGLARQSHRPVAIVCTSGTAGANFYPAVIEARESRVPLLVLTADRPPELRDCNAGQAIDQQKLFGHYPNDAAELALPDLACLNYLRQRILQAYQQTLYPIPGVVHLNLPFRDPLAPIEQAEILELSNRFPEDFFNHINPSLFINPISIENISFNINILPDLSNCDRGVIIAGVAQPEQVESYCQAIANLAETLGWAILAEGLSPIRNHLSHHRYLISTYDMILRNPAWAEVLTPEQVIRVGDMPTSKVLRQFLETTQPLTWVIDPCDRSLDPLHGKTIPIPWTIERFCQTLIPQISTQETDRTQPTHYLQSWQSFNSQVQTYLDRSFSQLETMTEPKVAWLLAKHLPTGTSLFIANSMPVRDVEWFWQCDSNSDHVKKRLIFVNRGANGIDGTLSTALGVSHHGQPSVLLTGDLALLHDTNGFLLRSHFRGNLTIIVLNNNGGGIFGMLPIAQFNPPFEEFFSTPQNINFAHLCQTYGVEYQAIASWQQLQQELADLTLDGSKDSPKRHPIRVLEVKCDRALDAKLRKQLLAMTPLLI
ncbi:MAG: 2-succinyl-5-enolpyruvyl-6-hydroxy-3-cyclohexene-1-carboxylic-acid synthase [Synechococcales bacterium]|nr:2-succinyl-5-enolpyruvyl-6-hydroxy-3-cyclohexene-1-carboxylic-acid synthase [Synechococcales bacterium]